MTEAERIAIEHACARLVALYANLNDEARWDDVASLYAPDGSMTRPTAPDEPIVGREAIAAAFKARPARKTRHICSNVVIDALSPTEAKGVSAMALFTPDAPPKLGSFHDDFVLMDGRWLFARRRGSLSF
ncbi:nuclear transport factor 2 family protein [Croceicoccus sediminis]|uniref:nuclear transport factor 2 family protein n=1 Tax=Croceicoccus sediminis TaxID=2571150 RepID=UPI0011836A08|nr:nuclear transport factor 2 family protein [Croceicoccus sediminis]